MDEKSMILEQERQEKAKKRKKRKKYKWMAGILAIVLAIGATWYVGWGRYLLAEKEADAVVIKVSAGQSVTYAKITAINGNEITYAIAEKMDVKLPENGEESAGEGRRPQMGGRGQMGGFGQMGSGRDNTNTTSAADTNMFTYEDAVYRVGEESVTTYIPVGTDVTTKLGTVTTFSRLSAGDCVAIVTEKDGDSQIIMAVYIIG